MPEKKKLVGADMTLSAFDNDDTNSAFADLCAAAVVFLWPGEDMAYVRRQVPTGVPQDKVGPPSCKLVNKPFDYRCISHN